MKKRLELLSILCIIILLSSCGVSPDINSVGIERGENIEFKKEIAAPEEINIENIKISVIDIKKEKDLINLR